MTTSGTATYNDYAVQLIKDALAMNGVTDPSQEQLGHAFQIANRVIKSIPTFGNLLHQREEVTLNLTASDKDYTLDADTLEIDNVRFRRDGVDDYLEPYSAEEYAELTTKTTTGDPNSYYIDMQIAAPVLYLYFVPTNSTSIVSNDGTDYRCIKDHTSAATDEPGVGANTATYWESIGSTGAYTAWALSTAYKSDVVKFDKTRKLEDITFVTNTIDLPSKQLDAFNMILAYRFSLSKMINKDGPRPDLRSESKELFAAMLADDNERGPMSISPRLDDYPGY